jgi:deazaflavin-dependent oxidoreductase (nitroreductase family)
MSLLFKAFTAVHVGLYRTSRGRLGGTMAGGKVLLLTTTGNKSGKERTVPVMYFDHDGQRYVIASAGGSPTHPAWFKNLQAKPDVTVEVGGTRYTARAEVVSGDERAQVWKKAVGQMPQFDGYERKTSGRREIPVVKLRETSASA